MRHTISVLVENKFGVLARIAGLFSARGFNIDSLSVGVTEDATVSRMTIVVKGDEKILEQVTKQLNKLIDVIKVVDLSSSPHVSREMVIVKVSAGGTRRNEILDIVNIFRGKIVDVAHKSFTIEITGDEGKVEAFLELIAPHGIRELTRTGTTALIRGDKSINKC